MKSLAPLGVLLLVAALPAGPAAAEEPRYGVCRQQIADYVRDRLGQTVTRIEIRSYAQHSMIMDPGDALVTVAECSGFHVFQVLGTETVCEDIPHYGPPGSWVRYEGALEGCATPR